MSRENPGPGAGFLNPVFGVYAWIVFAACVLFSLIVVTLVPGPGRRQRLTKAGARAFFWLCAIRVEVAGFENLPDGHCVVVANHASYIDGVLLKGYLPGRFSFVIKGEMRDIPVVHFLLRRAGSKFVERFVAAKSSTDARQIVKAARNGESLAFFPEGTFIERPGVGRFRAGAFMAAIKGDMPVVPIVLSGTRGMLSAGRLLPRPGRLRIEILPAIRPGDPAFGDSRTLAESARQRILTVLDEPDLLQNQ